MPDQARQRLLARLRQHPHNVSFRELESLVFSLGFRLTHVVGSHRFYSHPDVKEVLNLQPVRGEAKPYQIRQLLRLVNQYNLSPRDDP